MPNTFKLPDLGEGIHESEVAAIHVAVGDVVAEGDVILEVETDKATVEIPSPYSGKVIEILVQIGEVVQVGADMIRFDAAEDRQALQPASVKTDLVAFSTKEPISAPNVQHGPWREEPIPASPATRRLARELKVDLARVSGSGPAGLVTAKDVHRYVDKAVLNRPDVIKGSSTPGTMQAHHESRPLIVDGPSLPDFEKYGPVKRISLRSIRRSTAKQMTLAWSQIPHVTNQDTIDITELESFRKKHKADIARKGGRLTFTVLALKAAVTALKAHPRANASLDTATGEIILKQYYHIGVAVSTDDGLVVPVIRNVDQKSIMALCIELDQLVQRTRDRKVGIDEMRGGSFTLTNMGAIGGGTFTPIINYPNVAILGFGQARWQPMVHEKDKGVPEITARYVVPVVLAVDHRVMDGADAVRFLEEVKHCLRDPEWLLLNLS